MTLSLRPEALSPDGYIINQDKTDNIPYGRLASSINGCGWMAAYNLMKALGVPQDALAVCNGLAAGSPFGCLMGTGPRRLAKWLGQNGLALKTAFGRKKALALAHSAKAGIILYLHGAEPHYVAFVCQPGGGFRFFNAYAGDAAHLDSFEGFMEALVKWPLVYVMVKR